jgi:glutaredoxin-like protein
MILDEKTKTQVKELLRDIKDSVTLEYYKKEGECEFCPEIEELMNELSQLNKKIIVKEAKDNVKIKPAIEIKGKNLGRIFFMGLPAGYEFGPFLHAIIHSSTMAVDFLNQDTKEKLSKINKPVNIRIFATPSCMYCPTMALFGYGFAILNNNITTEVIEAAEFPDLVNKYRINAVPAIFINEKDNFVGALTQDLFLDRIIKAIS